MCEKYYCYICGKEIANLDDAKTHINEETGEAEYICPDCYEADISPNGGHWRFKECHDCYNIIDILVDEQYLDPETTEHRDAVCIECKHSYEKCDICGCWSDDLNGNTSDEKEVCEDCLNEHYRFCDSCNTYHPRSEVTYYSNLEMDICRGCREENYTVCDECGDLVHNDDAFYSDLTDGYYCCENCRDCAEDNYRDEHGEIEGYHHTEAQRFLKTERDACNERLFFGIELEVEALGYKEDYELADIAYEVKDLLPGDWEAKEDGSLSNGFELASADVFTFDYLNTTGKRSIEIALEHLVNAGMRSHDARHCGLHIHASREAISESAQIIMTQILSEGWEPYIKKLSRRTNFEYAGVPHAFEEVTTAAQVKKNAVTPEGWTRATNGLASDYDGMMFYDKYNGRYNILTDYDLTTRKNSNGHYEAINFMNDDTVELRLFKGTLNPESFFAAIHFYKALIDFSIAHEGDVEGTVLNKYLVKDFKNYMFSYSDTLRSYCHRRLDGEARLDTRAA